MEPRLSCQAVKAPRRLQFIRMEREKHLTEAGNSCFLGQLCYENGLAESVSRQTILSESAGVRQGGTPQSRHLCLGDMQVTHRETVWDCVCTNPSHFGSRHPRATEIGVLAERTEALGGGSPGGDHVSCIFASPVPRPQQMPRKRGLVEGKEQGEEAVAAHRPTGMI